MERGVGKARGEREARDGREVARQGGSHVTIVRFLVSVPLAKELDAGTLRRLERDAGLTVAEFQVAVSGGVRAEVITRRRTDGDSDGKQEVGSQTEKTMPWRR